MRMVLPVGKSLEAKAYWLSLVVCRLTKKLHGAHDIAVVVLFRSIARRSRGSQDGKVGGKLEGGVALYEDEIFAVVIRYTHLI